MVAMEQIRAVSDHIAREFQPERIILFGSYAYGTPREDSDVDLLVVMPFEGKGYMQSLEILGKVTPKFSLQVIVRTPEQLRQRLAWNDFFLREITEKGSVLYEASNHI